MTGNIVVARWLGYIALSADLLLLHAHLLTMQGDGVGYVRDGA